MRETQEWQRRSQETESPDYERKGDGEEGEGEKRNRGERRKIIFKDDAGSDEFPARKVGHQTPTVCDRTTWNQRKVIEFNTNTPLFFLFSSPSFFP